MNWKDWLLPWRAKAKIEELQACLNRSVDAAPFTAKINLLEDRLEQTIKSLKAALDEKHACATLLSSTRASEQDWRETASKIDSEKNELASLNRTLVDQLEHAKADVEEWKGRVKVERKEREDVEKAIGGMKAEVLEAQTLAAKASKLQEALDHEIAEHRLAKEQVVGLTKWIRVAHRLDSPSPKGTIRRILQSARFRTTSRSGTVTAMALLCFAWTALAQAPFWRNSWSTNQAPPVIGTNLWVSNTAQGQGWFFYNYPSSNTVARLRDITNAFTGLSASTTNFNGINVTNRALIGDLVVTNSGNTTNLTNWDMQTWKVQNNLGAFDNLELDVSSGLAQPSWTLGYANSEPTILGQVLVGNGNDVNGGNSTVVGISNYVSNTKTHIVVGSFDQAWGGQDGVVGHDSLVTNAYNFAFGNHITNITTESVEIGPSESNKVRISWLGLDGLTLPMVSTNTTNFGALVFPPAATTLSTNSLVGAWNVFNSNGGFYILHPSGGAGLLGVAVRTNLGGGIFASGGTLRLGDGGNTRMSMDSTAFYPSVPFGYDLGFSGGYFKNIFTSNLYDINLVVSNRAGIGTNTPQSALHVQGAQAELLRVDTISGGTGALTVSSNPVVRIRTEQATNQPLGCYGAMMMPLTNILAIGPTAYTNINGYSVLNTNWFRCNTNTGTISNVFAGYYRMTISASILGGNNEALEGCLLTNGVDSECISFYKVYDAASRFDVLSASGLLYLPTNCQCSFGLKTTTAGNVAIRRASIVIGTP